jgi:hypothetical protein
MVVVRSKLHMRENSGDSRVLTRRRHGVAPVELHFLEQSRCVNAVLLLIDYTPPPSNYGRARPETTGVHCPITWQTIFPLLGLIVDCFGR